MAFIDPDAESSSGFKDPDVVPRAKKSGDSPGVLGYGEALIEAPVKMFLGAGAKAGATATGLLGGEDLEQAVASGDKAAGKVTDWRAMDKTRGAEETLGHAFETGIQAIGGGAEIAATDLRASTPGVGAFADLMGMKKPYPQPGDAAPGLRTGAEAATELSMFGLGGMAARRAGARPAKPTEVPVKQEMGFVDPDVPTTRTKPESDALYNPTAPKPGEFIGEDGRKLVQEEYDPGIAPKLEPRETFGPREERIPEDKAPFEFEESKPTDPESIGRRKSLADTHNDKLSGILTRSARHEEESLNTVRLGLDEIKTSSDSPFYKELAKKLLEDEEFKPDFKLVKGFEDKENTSGRYRPGEHTVLIKEVHRGSERLLLHEAVHARTYAAIQAYLNRGLQTVRHETQWKEHFSHLEAPVKHILQMFETYKRDFLENENGFASQRPYGLLNVHEFVAEGFTNPEFQAKLASQELPRSLRTSSLRTYWDSFIKAVSNLFGFKGDKQTYLSELLREGSNLMSGMSKDERTYFSSEMSGTKDLGSLELEPVKKEIEKKGVMGAAIEQVRDFQLDKRPIEQVIDQNLSGKITDFTPGGKDRGLLHRAYDRLGTLVKENLLQDTTIALMMKNNAGTGPLIKWTVDQISRLDREYMSKTKQLLDSTLKPYRKMFWNREQRTMLKEMLQKWDENIGVKDLSKEDFKNDKQWQVYQGFQKAHDQILTEINAKRAEAGFKAIDRIPSYFHSMWEGDYRVFGKDASGNKKWATGYKTEAGALKDIKRLEKEHPDLTWEQSEVVRDKYGLIDLSAFEDALRVMSKDDPVTRAIQTTYRDVLQHRGFGRTGLHKKGVLGFMGMMEEGLNGLRDRERAFDQYVHQAYRYIGNLDKQKVLADLQKIPLEQRKQIPQTMDFLTSYIHKARGGREEVWYDTLAGEMTRAVGLGASLPKDAVRGMSQFATAYWLTTPRFLVSQTAQSLNALPKLIQEHGKFDGASLFFEGWKNTISPDAIAKEATQWATERQYLDPTIKNLIGKGISESPTGSRIEALRELASWPAAWIEHNVVRAPVFLMFEKGLRDAVPDKAKRFEIAAEKADYYMVNYGRVHAPAVYDKMGLIGDAARPLKQYSHNYIGQFIEYVQGAKNKGEYAPLATFFGVQAAVGGVKGMLLIAEATVAVNLINAIFDTNIPTPEKLMLTSGIHDAFIYGGMSTAMNVDISSSVAAPGAPTMLNFPPIEFTVGMVKDVGGFALKFLKGDETDHDRLRAWLAVTPTAAHEWLKNVYTPEGYPTVNPNDKQSRGNYRRDEGERLWTSLTGAKMIREAHADALIRNVKKELVRDLDRKMNSIDAIVDRIQNGSDIDPGLFKDYIKNGGDPSRLSETVVNRMKERVMTGVERQQQGSVTPPQAHKLQIMKDYLDSTTPDPIKDPMGFDPGTGEVRALRPISGEIDQPYGNYNDNNDVRRYKGKIKFPQGDENHRDVEKMAKMPFSDVGQWESYIGKRNKDIIDPDKFMQEKAYQKANPNIAYGNPKVTKM